MSVKFSLCWMFSLIVLMGCSDQSLSYDSTKTDIKTASKKNLPQGSQRMLAKVIYPKYTTNDFSPSNGSTALFNPISLGWPVENANDSYTIRLSQTPDFSGAVIAKDNIQYGIFNPNKILELGTWYWQVKNTSDNWQDGNASQTHSFIISEQGIDFAVPSGEDVYRQISVRHPRVLVAEKQQIDFIKNISNYPRDTDVIIKKADSYLNVNMPKSEDTKIEIKFKEKYKQKKYEKVISRKITDVVVNALESFSQAYMLTHDNKYQQTAKTWLLEVSSWQPSNNIGVDDFSDSSFLSSIAIAYDTFHHSLSKKQRQTVLNYIKYRTHHMMSHYMGMLEGRTYSAHFYQLIAHDLVQTLFAVAHDIPEAELWFSYIYDLWLYKSPILGGENGAWSNGPSYYSMNGLALYDIPAMYEQITGVNYKRHPFYVNNAHWLMNAHPPSSTGDGFNNDGDKYLLRPPIKYAAFMDVIAREFNDPQAAWYADKTLAGLKQKLSDDSEYRWYRLKRGYQLKRPQALVKPFLENASFYPDVGVAYMHSNYQNMDNNMQVSMRSGLWGGTGHMHSDQNTFNLAYGGKRVFYNSGYRVANGDPHYFAWYKQTIGHNGVLIDGKGQPMGANDAYGWMPRFLHGEQLSYAVGDASNAYRNSFAESGNKNTQGDTGLTHFRRHYIMLRPNILVVYDDLIADHKADWTWLLHNQDEMLIDEQKQTIIGDSELATGHVNLFSSQALNFSQTDEFTIPVENWREKRDIYGKLYQFENTWHFRAENKKKAKQMRFLAIIQLQAKDGSKPLTVNFDQATSVATIGDWQIQANLETTYSAKISINKKDGSVSFVSSGPLPKSVEQPKTLISAASKLFELKNGQPSFQQTADVIPQALLDAERNAQ
jgi:hypothetical protein